MPFSSSVSVGSSVQVCIRTAYRTLWEVIRARQERFFFSFAATLYNNRGWGEVQGINSSSYLNKCFQASNPIEFLAQGPEHSSSSLQVQSVTINQDSINDSPAEERSVHNCFLSLYTCSTWTSTCTWEAACVSACLCLFVCEPLCSQDVCF